MRVLSLLLLVAVFAVAVTADTCGGNCPSGDCPSGECKCGTRPNHVDIGSYCKQHSGWSQKCCECIASHESGGNANAENYNENGSYDIGLYQVNDINWGVCSGGQPPCNPQTNLECAIKVWNWGGGTWRLWSTCHVCGCCDSP